MTANRISAFFALPMWIALTTSIYATEWLSEPPTTRQAPDFTATDHLGVQHKMADYAQRVVIVNFWATWCPPCIKEMPSLQRTADTLKEHNIAVLAVSVGDAPDDVRQFAERLDLTIPLLIDQNMQLSEKWQVKGLPTTYVVAPSGAIAYRVVGERHWDDPEILAAIRALAE